MTAEGGLGPVRQEKVGSTLVLLIDSPPVNALSHGLRAGLWAGIEAAEADPEVRSVVITAEGRTFPAGADISEFGQKPRAPLLPDLCNRIEACTKPVIAAIHGTALGGGLEIALAAHHRLALNSARLGLPEVTLGVLPGAGGTQRLPRLVGAAPALQMMLSGRPVSATDAATLGLVDRLCDRDLIETALSMAGGVERRPTRARDELMGDAAGWMAAVLAARKSLRGAHQPAAARIVDCVEAALLLPFDQALDFERSAFLDLVDTPEAAALRHLFFAERRAGRMPGARAEARPLRAALVIGAGNEGADLALSLLRAGLRVTLADSDQITLVPGLERIAATQADAVAAGRMSEAARDADWARLTPALTDAPPDDEDADIVFLTGRHAVPGADLPRIATRPAPGVPVVTMGRPGGHGRARSAGLILSPPGPAGRGAEILVTEVTAPETVATLLAALRRIDRVAVMARGPGIGAPVMAALGRAARHLSRLHGAAPVEAVLRGWGLQLPNLPEPPRDAAPAPDMAPDLVHRRLMGAMANEGLRLLGAGTALRPSDIDVAVVLGRGFPRWEGGPMHWADARGLLVLRAELSDWEAEAPDLWSPSPILETLIRDGRRLSALDDA